MTSVAGFQYRRTLEDLYREGDPEISLRFDDHAGIQAINSVFYRRNQEELGDSADAVVLAQYKALQHRQFAGRTGMTEDDSRMLEDRRAPPPSVPAPAAAPGTAPAHPEGIEIPVPGWGFEGDDLDDDVQPGDAAHPVVAPAVAEAAEEQLAVVSRRAQFAQATGAGLSRVGGAAESIINHSAAAMRLIPMAAGHSMTASRSMAALAAGPSSAALQLLPAAAGHSASAMRQLPALADTALRRVGTEMLTEAGIWGDAIGSVIGPGGRPAQIAADALIMGAHQASRNHGEYSGYARSAWNAATPVGNLLRDWLLTPPARAPEPTYAPIQFMTAPSGAAASSAPALADAGMPYLGWGTGPAYSKPSAPALPAPMRPPAILAPPPVRVPPHARAKAASRTRPQAAKPVAPSKSAAPTGPRGVG